MYLILSKQKLNKNVLVDISEPHFFQRLGSYYCLPNSRTMLHDGCMREYRSLIRFQTYLALTVAYPSIVQYTSIETEHTLQRLFSFRWISIRLKNAY